MLRDVIEIDENKCDGCGHCVTACHEGAIQMVAGKAKLVADVYCDGLGACIGHCPQNAITVVKRDTVAFDEKAVEVHLQKLGRPPMPAAHAHPPAPAPAPAHSHAAGGGCPGTMLRSFAAQSHRQAPATGLQPPAASSLAQWPVQLRLVPPQAPFLRGAEVLLCADCVPFALADFHQRYLRGRPLLVACPKLDDNQFNAQKLAAIFQAAQPSAVVIARMEVPCCGGLQQAARLANEIAGTDIPIRTEVVGIDGTVR